MLSRMLLATLFACLLASCDGGGSGGIVPECGDGFLDAGEECDDGNLIAGDGCDEACQIEAPRPLGITGEYLVDIQTTSDDCGFGPGSASSPVEVVETGVDSARVDVPQGGAGGECNPEVYARAGNTLTRMASAQQQIGPCIVQLDLVTVLDFFEGGSLAGTETNSLSAAGGDCSGLTLPCTIELALDGSRCRGCFQCVAPFAPGSGAGLGFLGAGRASPPGSPPS